MYYFKVFLLTISFVILSVAIDSFFDFLGIPVVTLDLLFLSASAFIMYLALKPRFFKSGFVADHVIQYSIPKLCLWLTALFFFLLFAAVLIYIGIKHPLLMLDGYKGRIHCYSILASGVGMFALFSRFGCLALYERYKVKKRSKVEP